MTLVGSPPPRSLPIRARLAALEARFREVEPEILAFLPEPNRFERLRREEERLRISGSPGRTPGKALLLGVKDVFHVDGMATLAGTGLSAGRFTGSQAAVVDLLRRAGALIVGKTVSTELAYFAPGPTRNPHRLEHTPGGSSSGSAAAVAAGLCDAALGTQTIGSVCRPATFCGIWGFKPSRGRVSAAGLVPLAPSLDHVGWFARSRSGIVEVARVVIEEWEPAAGGFDPARPRRIALPVGPYLDRAGAAMLERLRQVADRWTAGGGEVVEVAMFADFEEVEARHRRILAREFRQVHGALLDEVGERLNERTRALAEAGREVSEGRYAEDRAAAAALAAEIDRRMEEGGLDAWLTPAAPGPAPAGLEETGDPVMNLPWTQVGLPALSVPAGTDDDGLPLGLQWVGRRHGDEALLQLVAASRSEAAAASEGDGG